ncbi:spore germination protein [Paenibacillus glycanilyticus]|uniref:spore germination protein n=1 Tax=Paenibacillus glycanilyticus TaxID=126569 RepID=UPI001910368C
MEIGNWACGNKGEYRSPILFAILFGEVVVTIDGELEAITVSIAGSIGRSVKEPSSQTIVRVPKEGYTEELSTNIACSDINCERRSCAIHFGQSGFELPLY